MNYEEDIRIDETALDIEWLEQATLAMKYGKYWAFCKKRLEEVEERLKVLKAEMNKEVNEDPDKFLGKGVKATVANVDAYCFGQKRYKELKQECIDTQFELDMAEIARNEICYTRKAALENLVRLHGQQYFAGPQIPRDLAEERQRKQRKNDEAIASSMKRRTK